jgi:cyanophycinase
MAEEFREVGATDVRALELRTRDDAQDPAIVAALRGARGIWLTGGDQSRITAALRGTPAFGALRSAHRGGAVLGGTSAGTACMTPVMLTGSGDRGVIEAGNVPLAPGLGFLPGVVVDQHFVARQRQNRLLSVVLEDQARLGVGVDEATAIEVNLEAGTFEVRGDGWVYVFDASRARVRREGDQLGVTGLRTHVLLAGQGFDLRRREPR